MLSSLIFAIGHIARAFTNNNILIVRLTVINAFIFGWLAIKMTLIVNNILPAIITHVIFDFETKIIVMTEQNLLIAKVIHRVLMVIISI